MNSHPNLKGKGAGGLGFALVFPHDVTRQLYDTARAALVDLPSESWSFMVLNQTGADSKNGDNFNNCQDLAVTLNEKHLAVVNCFTANCANAEAANKVMDEVLDYLAAKITYLDQQYASACQERLIQIQKAVHTELAKAQSFWGRAAK